MEPTAIVRSIYFPRTYFVLARSPIRTMSRSVSDSIKELPPSAKLVFKVLEWEGPLTQQQLAEESMLAERTVRYALDRLDEIDMIHEEIYFADARQQLYELSSTSPNNDHS